MTDRDRCTDTNPHPAHRTQYGGFGLKDCPGIPMTSREELREERVTTGRLEGDLRSQTRAVREALAERDEAREQLVAGVKARTTVLTDEIGRWKAKLTEARADRDDARRERDDYRQELGAAGEVLAVVRDAVERIDRALATYDTTPGEEEADTDAVQNLLDDSTKAFAAADTSSERVEVIRDLLDGWYAHWPKTAVTDPHEGIAWQLASLISAAEARASAPSSVPPRRAQEPQPGQFCTEHFSWLCQAGQGRCQGKREG